MKKNSIFLYSTLVSATLIAMLFVDKFPLNLLVWVPITLSYLTGLLDY